MQKIFTINKNIAIEDSLTLLQKELDRGWRVVNSINSMPSNNTIIYVLELINKPVTTTNEQLTCKHCNGKIHINRVCDCPTGEY